MRSRSGSGGNDFAEQNGGAPPSLTPTDASMTIMGIGGHCEPARDARTSFRLIGGASCSGRWRNIGGEGIAVMQVPERHEQIFLPAPADGADHKAGFAGNRIDAFHQSEIAIHGGIQQSLKIGSVMIGYRHHALP